MKNPLKHDLRSLYSVTGFGVMLFVVLSIGTLTLQQRIVAIATESRNQVLPKVQARLRMVRNIELLRGYGNIAYRTTDLQVRQEAGFLSILLTAHPSVEADPATLPLLREANGSIQSRLCENAVERPCANRVEPKLLPTTHSSLWSAICRSDVLNARSGAIRA